MKQSAIARSIWITVGYLFLGQCGITIVIMVLHAVPIGNVVWYPIALVATHIVMAAALSSLASLFRIVNTGVALSRVNVANILSMSRISAAPTLLLLVLLSGTYPLTAVVVILAALVFLTDLLDGQISRRTGQVTEIGQYLDSSSDYALLVVVSSALVWYQLIELWVFILILVRLLIQFIGQIVLYFARSHELEFRSSFLGKASVFAMMALLTCALLLLVPDLPEWVDGAYRVLTWLVAAIVGVSLIEKVGLVFVELFDLRRRKRSP